MLTSLAFIFLLGFLLSSIFQKIKLPGLLGMLITGILLGPYALNLLDHKILTISPDLRQLALVIILTRAGLNLDIGELKKVGRPAVLMCFVPACFEILGILILAPRLLNISLLEAAIMGTVLAAVSPAVIVPRMIKLMEEGYGTKKGIPGLILAGASVDDVFVIVLFTAFTSLAAGNQVAAGDFISIPVSIVVGLFVGVILGLFLSFLFQKIHMRDSAKVIILLGISFLLIELEKQLKSILPLSGLLAIMTMGVALYKSYPVLAKRIATKFNQLWVAAEIILFVLVGATVDIRYAVNAGVLSAVVVLGALVFRMAGVFICLLKTELTLKERFFCMLAYLPKATVQAAIGTIPLSMGLSCGKSVLTIAVLSIIITAPLGAFLIDFSYPRLLHKENSPHRK
ncbi:MAG: sodium:proton antiporter [Herbinix sp.]|jgi:NhaP-type Na+/H+ or K+/H+ antiporter|nr:sodium:proton antiporter [Herbinix sp.]